MLALAVGVVALLMVATSFFSLRKGAAEKRSHKPEAENSQQSRRPAMDYVPVRMDHLADYGTYRTGTRLDRELFVAWSLDPNRTTLGQEAFRENVEGATVVWEMRVTDLKAGNESIIGDFTIPCGLSNDGGNPYSVNPLPVRCEFSPDSRESLLGVRSRDWVRVQGNLSLKGDAVIRNCRLAGKDAEAE